MSPKVTVAFHFTFSNSLILCEQSILMHINEGDGKPALSTTTQASFFFLNSFYMPSPLPCHTQCYYFSPSRFLLPYFNTTATSVEEGLSIFRKKNWPHLSAPKAIAQLFVHALIVSPWQVDLLTSWRWDKFFYEFFLRALSTSLSYSMLLFLSFPIFIAVLQHHHHICRRRPV